MLSIAMIALFAAVAPAQEEVVFESPEVAAVCEEAVVEDSDCLEELALEDAELEEGLEEVIASSDQE